MKTARKAFTIILIIAINLPFFPTASGWSAPLQAAIPGQDSNATIVGATRFRAFALGTPDTDPEVYLGIPNLNSPHNRSELDLQWDTQNVFTFTYNTTNDWLMTAFNNSYGNWAVTYPDFSTHAPISYAYNYLEILIALRRDSPTLLSLQNVYLDGDPLGDFHGDRDIGFQYWMVTDHDLSNGFTMTGTLHITSTEPVPDELNKIEISFGYSDQQGPGTSDVTSDPNPVVVGETMTVTAQVDDSTTGGATIASAEYSLDGGSTWSPMQAQDGAFDEVSETVTATQTAPTLTGAYDLCARGTDAHGNTGAQTCTTLIVIPAGDDQAPLASNVAADPNPVVVSSPVTFTATVDDSSTGGSPIQSAEYSLDGGATWSPMQAQDGAFDGVSEAVTLSTTAPATNGNYNLCVRGSDWSGNTGAQTCITLIVLPVGDNQGPLTSDVAADPNPVVVSSPVTFAATVDDSSTGGSPIQSAEYSLDGGATWYSMQAQDGAFDGVSEAVTISTTAPATPNGYSLCVRGTDMSSNLGDESCTTLIVLPVSDDQGPITSNVAADPNPVVISSPVTYDTTINDSTTGGSPIQSAEYSLDGGLTWSPMQAQDGAFDEVSEAVTLSTTAPATNGNYDLCVRGTDWSGNTGAQTCTTLFVLASDDDQGPITSDVAADPNPVVVSSPVTFTATVDDSSTGGSPIQSAEYSLDGGLTWSPMQAQDGAFDEVSEAVTLSTNAPATNGNYNLCVRGTDWSGNTGAQTCTTLFVLASDDDQGPITSDLTADPNPVVISSPVMFTANVDDSSTGGSPIQSAEYSLDGGLTWSPMQAQDGAFDQVSEAVTTSTTAPATNGNYNLCVRGTDMSGNTGSQTCTTLFVLPAGDDQGPTTSNVAADPNPVVVSSPVTITATIDDSSTGGSPIQSAEYSLDGGLTWSPMQAQDGAFDEVLEAVTLSTTAPATNGNYNLCVRGSDWSGNSGPEECIALEVISVPEPASPSLYLPVIMLAYSPPTE